MKLRASNHAIKISKRGTLVDRGANGGILGNDAKVVFRRNKSVDVTGIDNHELSSLPMVDAISLSDVVWVAQQTQKYQTEICTF